jgi:hypothetical protein
MSSLVQDGGVPAVGWECGVVGRTGHFVLGTSEVTVCDDRWETTRDPCQQC